jgi:hypothetical protein
MLKILYYLLLLVPEPPPAFPRFVLRLKARFVTFGEGPDIAYGANIFPFSPLTDTFSMGLAPAGPPLGPLGDYF